MTLDFVHRVPVLSYLANPNAETAQVATEFLHGNKELVASIEKLSKKATLLFGCIGAICYLLYTRQDILEQEQAQSAGILAEAMPVSTLFIAAKFLLCLMTLSGLTYLNCYAGDSLMNYTIEWIQSSH